MHRADMQLYGPQHLAGALLLVSAAPGHASCRFGSDHKRLLPQPRETIEQSLAMRAAG